MNNDVQVRLIGQRRLTSEDRPLQLVAIVYEAALHREIGGQEVMREQLRHLVEMSKLPTVTLRVVPLREGAGRVPNAPFNLLRFPDPEDPALLHIEYPTGALHIEAVAEVRQARLIFDQLETSALSQADSVALIERLAEELYGPTSEALWATSDRPGGRAATAMRAATPTAWRSPAYLSPPLSVTPRTRPASSPSRPPSGARFLTTMS